MSSRVEGSEPDQPQPQTVENELAVPPSIAEIVPFISVADEVEPMNSRVAYLCRFYAFEKAHRLDPTSRGRGVRQYKTTLLGRLESDNEATLMGRGKQSDACEMQSFYQHYYRTHIQELENAPCGADHAQSANASQTANVLYEVLKAINLTEAVEIDCEILEMQSKVAEKTQVHVPSNILPLGPDSATMAKGEQRMKPEEDTNRSQGDQSLHEQSKTRSPYIPSPSSATPDAIRDYFFPPSDGQNEKK